MAPGLSILWDMSATHTHTHICVIYACMYMNTIIYILSHTHHALATVTVGARNITPAPSHWLNLRAPNNERLDGRLLASC